MNERTEMSFGLYWDESNVECCYDFFNGDENFADEKWLSESVELVIGELAGIPQGGHFTLYVNADNEVALNAIVDYSCSHGIGLTLMYPGERKGEWIPKEV